MASFLFTRVLKNGHDSRFDKVKTQPHRFVIYWAIQAIWAIVCLTPVIAVCAVHPAAFKAGLGVPEVLLTDVVGFGLFGVGLLIEVVADWQKAAWQAKKERKVHDELFITRGLWGRW